MSRNIKMNKYMYAGLGCLYICGWGYTNCGMMWFEVFYGKRFHTTHSHSSTHTTNEYICIKNNSNQTIARAIYET